MKYINIYFLDGVEYDGDIYFMQDSNNNGFICASDPNFVYLLTVIKVNVNKIIKRNFGFINIYEI